MASRTNGYVGNHRIAMEIQQTHPSLAQLVEISRILKVEVQDLIEIKYNEESTQLTEENKIEYR